MLVSLDKEKPKIACELFVLTIRFI